MRKYALLAALPLAALALLPAASHSAAPANALEALHTKRIQLTQ